MQYEQTIFAYLFIADICSCSGRHCYFCPYKMGGVADREYLLKT